MVSHMQRTIDPSRSAAPRKRVAAAFLVGALVLAACSDDDSTSTDDTVVETSEPSDVSTAGDTTEPVDPAEPTAPAGTGEPDGGEGAEVVVGAVLEPTSLDIVQTAGAALDQILLDNIYETLLSLDVDNEIGSGLAELSEVSDDGTVYTLTLPSDVTFHDGRPLTSADVKWSLETLSAEGANPAQALAAIDTVEAPDETTVVVTLSQPDSDFAFQLTQRGGAVMPADATDLDNNAIGTGPFTLVDWNVGSSITLQRYDDYWGELPSIDGVTFLYFTDPNAAVNAFTTGDVDILTGVNTDLVGPLQDNPDYVVNVGESTGEFTLGMNNAREPFNNHDVRLAVRQAIDKEAFRELNNGFGTIIGGPVPPSDPWYEDLTDVAPYDPDAARALLAGAGYGDGLDVTLVWPNFYPTTNAEFVASQLGDVGIDVTIETVEFGVWLEQVFTNHDYDMTAVLHAEPRDMFHYADPTYYWQYDSPEAQQLFNEAKTSIDADQATELFRQAARQISEDSPVDWLALAADLTVSRTNLTGYPINNTASRFDLSGITVAG